MTFPALWAAAWRAEGRDLPAAAGVATCELCGHDGPAVPWTPPSSWTAHSTHAVPGVGTVCQGCALLLGPSPDTSTSGRPLRWTLYTLATDSHRCEWMLKDQAARIAARISEGWSVSVADQGKRHIAYLAPTALPGRVRVGLDGDPIDVRAADYGNLAAAVADARRRGVRKTSLLGELDHNAHRQLGPDARRIDRALGPYRHTATLRLAVLLDTTTKEEAI